MQIKFKTKKLEKQYLENKEAIKAYGKEVGEKYISRVNILKYAKSFDDLYTISTLRFHPLHGNREGEFALSLTGYWRLIITNIGDSFDIVRIEEVSDHYGD